MNKSLINLRYSDTDQMGVIYHANYFKFYEIGRTNYLKDAGYDYVEVEKTGIIYPVRNVQSTYLTSIRLGETIYVYTKIKKLTKVQITFSHEIRNDKDELKSVGETTIVCVDAKTFKPRKMPEDMIPKFSKLKDEDSN